MSNLKQELMLSSCLINSLSSRQMRAPVHTVCLSSECLTPPGAIVRQFFSTVNEVKDEKYSQDAECPVEVVPSPCTQFHNYERENTQTDSV